MSEWHIDSNNTAKFRGKNEGGHNSHYSIGIEDDLLWVGARENLDRFNGDPHSTCSTEAVIPLPKLQEFFAANGWELRKAKP